MKTSEIKWLTMLLFTAMLFITACSDDTIRPPYLEEEIEPTPETKEFVVYDAMSYKNKPDLTSDMISNIRLIYEAFLLTNEEIDMDKVATQSVSQKHPTIKLSALILKLGIQTRPMKKLKPD